MAGRTMGGKAMRAELERIVGAASVDERPVRDLWPLAAMRARAGALQPRVPVVRPAGIEQLRAVLRGASGAGVGVTPLGGGSGVCGALEGKSGEIVVDMGAFDRIVEIDELNLTCRCEAGCNGLELERRLNQLGLTLGHYPSSLPRTSVGGLVSTRSSGQESSRYGNIEDMVMALSVMLPDGTLAGPRPGPRSAVGPALHEIFIGAEGALGIVVEAVLKVHRLPESTIGRGFSLPDLESGLTVTRLVMQAGVRPVVLRLYDPEDAAFGGYDLPSGHCLLVVATAGERSVAEAEAALVKRLAGASTELGEGPWERWQHHRFDLSAERLAAMLAPSGAYLDTIEMAGPWSVLPELHRRVKTAIAVGGLSLCHFSHAYEQGCCAYFSFGGAADDEPAAEAAYWRAWEGAMAAAMELGATIGHHHGVGQVRARWAPEEMGGWMRVWDSVKTALDPQGIMNRRAVGGLR